MPDVAGAEVLRSPGHATVASDPTRRFFVYVKSDPPGADIFVEDEPTPIGSTPVTLPIGLNQNSAARASAWMIQCGIWLKSP